METLEAPVPLAQLVKLDNEVKTEQTDSKELPERQVQLVSQVLLATQVPRVQLAILVPSDPLGR
jgi:hypothetical protein